MTVLLGRQEAVARFGAYLDYVTALDPMAPDDEPHDLEDNEMEEPAHCDISTHSVAIKPAFPHMDLNTLATDFRATNFIPALSTFIRPLIPPPLLSVLPNNVDRFDVYKRITILRPSNPAARFPKSVDRLRATPSVPAHGRSDDHHPRHWAVPAHFDTVLVHVADANKNQHTKGTWLEGMFI